MNYRAICFGLLAFFLVGSVSTRAQGRFEISPFVGFETSGSYPLTSNSNVIITNPIDRLRVNQATSYGTFLDYNLTENFQAEFLWDRNNTSYSARQVSTARTSRRTTPTLISTSSDFSICSATATTDCGRTPRRAWASRTIRMAGEIRTVRNSVTAWAAA